VAKINNYRTNCEGSLKEKRISLSLLISVFDFFKSYSGTLVSPSFLLEIGYGGPDDTPTFQGECSFLKLSFNIFLLIFRKYEYIFFLGSNNFFGHTLANLTLRLWECLLHFVSPVWESPTVQLRRMTVFVSFFYRKALCGVRIDEPSCPVPRLNFQTVLRYII
jgi:hypothetical protein